MFTEIYPYTKRPCVSFFYDYGIPDNRDNSLHLARKCALIFISEKRTVFRQRTVNFKAVVFISLRNISLGYSILLAGHVQSRDAFGAIAC